MKTVTSRRLETIPASPIRKLIPYATAAKKKGVKVYHLNIGDPDIPTPKVMLNAVKNWPYNPISYSQSQGDPQFLTAMKGYYHKLGFRFIGEENIQITLGGSEAISMAFFCIADPGDEIITFEPYYSNYNSYAAVNDIRIKALLTKPEDGFHLPSRKRIEEAITKKTKAIFVCNPNNPTGTVYTRSEIEMLLNIAKKNKLFLISDEVYREFVYDGKKHTSLLTYMKGYPKRTILLDSLSKRYSLCGARLGVLVSLNEDVMRGALRIGQGRLSAGTLDQYVGAQLTRVPKSYFSSVHKEYQKRRDVLYKGLRAIQGVSLKKPEGAFYTIVDLPVKDSDHFCQWLLTDFRDRGETIMMAPAAGFYGTEGRGKNQVRIAYVINRKDLKRSIELLKNALIEYNRS